MAEFTRTWFDCSENVLEEHSDIKIRQRYCFLFTKDKHIVIVSKNNEDWHFPGGHPNGTESWQETLLREVYEETGIDIEDNLDCVAKLGYYLIKFPEEKFLQERYVIVLDKLAAELTLEPHEDEDDDTPVIKFVKAVPISDIEKLIPWAPTAEGWNRAVEYFDENVLLKILK